MTTGIAGIRKYLRETIDVDVSPVKWADTRRLPLFLRDGYEYFEVVILNLPCLFMCDEGLNERSPATVRKHMEQVRTKWDGEIVYVRQQLAAYERKRLIEQAIPFIVPGNQMYLPMLAIDLREHFRTRHQTPATLSPATQVAVLYFVLRAERDVYTPAELADQLGYTKMSMTRVFNELEAEELADIAMRGRERRLTLNLSRQQLWQKALPLLRSPVKRRKRLHVRASDVMASGETTWLIAGLSALATYSMLASPPTTTMATTTRQWKHLKNRFDWQPAVTGDPDSFEVELWSYEPTLLATGQAVDRLSLFLSLKDDDDERVQGSLEEMMEGIRW